MNLPKKDIIEACKILADENSLKVTFKETAKGALIVGSGALVGGLLGGPIGMGVGGMAGTICAVHQARGKFKSVVSIIKEMSSQQQDRLAQVVKQCLGNLTAENVGALLVAIYTRPQLKQQVMKQIGTFAYNEFCKNI